jgi:hypothetical protein
MSRPWEIGKFKSQISNKFKWRNQNQERIAVSSFSNLISNFHFYDCLRFEISDLV